jgi:hypothetical protein
MVMVAAARITMIQQTQQAQTMAALSLLLAMAQDGS